MGEQAFTQDEWRAKVRRAASQDKKLRKREAPIKVKTPFDIGHSQPEKRWFGAFREWIKKLTTVTKSSVGVIELGLSKTINLFYARWGCEGETFFGELSMDLEADLSMDATYAYYLSATFIPPSKPDTFAYFGMEPEAYIGLHVEGRAQAQTQTERKKIIDTLTYPGLAVKGIAAVGPTLDIYGQIRGKITLYGSLDAGAKMSFGKAEVFWPQDDEVQEKYTNLLGLESKTSAPAPGEIEPVFHAGVAVDAQIDVIITPQANMGIKIGGGKLVAGKTLMDAQLSGYVNGDLSFQAHGDYDSSDNAFHYRFGAYLFYNIGYKAKAKILSVIDWATGDRMAYNPDKMLQLYEKKGTIPMSHSNAEKRDFSIHTDRIPQIDADLLDNTTHSVLNPAADIFRRTDISGSGDPKTPEFSNNGKCPPGATGFRVPELRFNCAFLSTYQVVNEIKDADGDVSERLTEDVPGLCDDIVKLNPLQSRFTFSQGEKYTKPRYKSVCPDGTCRQATRDLNAAVRRSNLQLQCDEFPWKSSEQGGTWLPASQRRAKCVPSFQNNWHGQCLGMMGSLTSNWKQLNSALREDSDVPDLWVPWQDKTKWVTAGDYGKNGDYKQKLVLYESAMPPPDGADQGDNDKFSWAYKRDYDVSWLQPQSSLTAGDWWGAGSPKFDKPNYQGPLDMDSILCAINHFNQDKAFKLPGAQLKPDGTPSNKPQKEYNAYCMRTDAGGMQPASWNMRFNMGKCLVKFQNPASSSPGSSKRDMGKWQGWEVENVEWVEDVDDEEWL